MRRPHRGDMPTRRSRSSPLSSAFSRCGPKAFRTAGRVERTSRAKRHRSLPVRAGWLPSGTRSLAEPGPRGRTTSNTRNSARRISERSTLVLLVRGLAYSSRMLRLSSTSSHAWPADRAYGPPRRQGALLCSQGSLRRARGTLRASPSRVAGDLLSSVQSSRVV